MLDEIGGVCILSSDELQDLILYGEDDAAEEALVEFNRRKKDRGLVEMLLGNEIGSDMEGGVVPQSEYPDIPEEYALTALGWEHVPSRPASKFGIAPDIEDDSLLGVRGGMDMRTYLVGAVRDPIYLNPYGYIVEHPAPANHLDITFCVMNSDEI